MKKRTLLKKAISFSLHPNTLRDINDIVARERKVGLGESRSKLVEEFIVAGVIRYWVHVQEQQPGKR